MICAFVVLVFCRYILCTSVDVGEKAEQTILHSVAVISPALHHLRVGNQHIFLLHGFNGETGGTRDVHTASLRRE